MFLFIRADRTMALSVIEVPIDTRLFRSVSSGRSMLAVIGHRSSRRVTG